MESQQSSLSVKIDRPKATMADVFILLGGAFLFLFSFLPFVAYDQQFRGPFKRSNLDTWFNAWQFETFMAPLTWMVVLAGVAMIASVAIRLGTNGQLKIFTFSFQQLEIVLALFATLVLLGYGTSTKSVYFGTEWANSINQNYDSAVNFGVGGYLMFFSAVIALVGTVMNLVGWSLPLETEPVNRQLEHSGRPM